MEVDTSSSDLSTSTTILVGDKELDPFDMPEKARNKVFKLEDQVKELVGLFMWLLDDETRITVDNNIAIVVYLL